MQDLIRTKCNLGRALGIISYFHKSREQKKMDVTYCVFLKYILSLKIIFINLKIIYMFLRVINMLFYNNNIMFCIYLVKLFLTHIKHLIAGKNNGLFPKLPSNPLHSEEYKNRSIATSSSHSILHKRIITSLILSDHDHSIRHCQDQLKTI